MTEETQVTENLAVIVERLTNIQDENTKEHSLIFEQVKKINGTVADLSKWRYLITGALIIMNIVFIPIILAVIIQFAIKNIF